jgi:hypothetical protein
MLGSKYAMPQHRQERVPEPRPSNTTNMNMSNKCTCWFYTNNFADEAVLRLQRHTLQQQELWGCEEFGLLLQCTPKGLQGQVVLRGESIIDEENNGRVLVLKETW